MSDTDDISDVDDNGANNDDDNDDNDNNYMSRPLRRTDLLISHQLVDDAFTGALR